MKPLAKRGELDQGILAFTWLSLKLVAQGYAIALRIGTPLGFCLGLSKTFAKICDPINARKVVDLGCRAAKPEEPVPAPTPAPQ